MVFGWKINKRAHSILIKTFQHLKRSLSIRKHECIWIHSKYSATWQVWVRAIRMALVALIWNSHMVDLYCVSTYIHAFLIDKDLCKCQNFFIKLPCALLVISFIQRPLQFFSKNFPFYCIFCYPYFATFLFYMVYKNNIIYPS